MAPDGARIGSDVEGVRKGAGAALGILGLTIAGSGCGDGVMPKTVTEDGDDTRVDGGSLLGDGGKTEVPETGPTERGSDNGMLGTGRGDVGRALTPKTEPTADPTVAPAKSTAEVTAEPTSETREPALLGEGGITGGGSPADRLGDGG